MASSTHSAARSDTVAAPSAAPCSTSQCRCLKKHNRPSRNRMTKRLYYTDPLLTSFDAKVVSCTPAADRFEAVLDQTAFYPSSGGQPFDTGTLGGARVVDVVDDDD